MGEFSIAHWLIVLAILLIFFGPSKLPGLGASLGKAIRGFKQGLNEDPPSETAKSNPEQLSGTGNSTHVSSSTKVKDPVDRA